MWGWGQNIYEISVPDVHVKLNLALVATRRFRSYTDERGSSTQSSGLVMWELLKKLLL